ncbi:DNA topoisomerase VI subunit B [Candidatus Hodarchaeum mangrovi]
MGKAAKAKEEPVTREKVVKRSAADFFQDNKAIAGFDNTMRVVFTSVRELVENGLDAAERVGHLPELHIVIQRLMKEEIAKLLNIKTFESSEKIDFLRLSVRDNGSGIESEFIPPLFGRVLTGSNYGSRQSRGRFGLGAKMVLLNAMSSVDLPLIIKSKHLNEDFTSYHELMINLAENEPIIINKREIPQTTTEAIIGSGTEVTVTFTGSWNLASRWIREYFSQLSLITPYASFYITYPDSDTPEILERVVEEMPPYPQLAKVHPWGTDITQFKRELAVTTSSTMVDFLQDHFQGIGEKTAKEFLDFIKVSHDLSPNELSTSDIRRIVHEGFVIPDSDPKRRRKQNYFPFRRPSGDSLSPLGSELLSKGIEKELSPQFVRSATGDVSAYSGHPFIIESALAYGGTILSKDESSKSGNPRIYRFANRIPLLFGAGNDIITKCVQKMNWKNYKINISKSPIAIVVSVVSSKIPFPETSKEYIADVDELREEIMRVLKKLARELSHHLGRAERERREKQRQSRFESAAPKVIINLAHILEGTPTPFLLNSSEETCKLEKALASAVPRHIRRSYPPSPFISNIGEWLLPETYAMLVENNIQTIYQFLKASSAELSKITGFSENEILTIKRRTVTSEERSKLAPAMRDFEVFSKIIENDYGKYKEAPRIHRALNKRWIVSTLDFFVTPISQLRLVEFFQEKLIYELKLKAITLILVDFPVDSIDLNKISWITPDIDKGLRSFKITNIFEYLMTFPEKLSNVPNLSIQLLEGIKQNIREGIEQGYIDENKVIGAATFEWMDYRVTPRLRGRNISKISEFLQTPSEKLAEIQELAENLIFQSKRLIADSIQELNTEELLLKYTNIQISMKSDLERIQVKGLIDFLLANEKDLLIVRGLVDKLVSQKQDELLVEIEQSAEFFPTKNAYWLDPQLENALRLIGIQTVFDFIKYPSKKLLKFKNLNPLVLESIKRVYGSPIPFLSSEELSELEKNNIYCLEELQSVVNDEKIKPVRLNEKIQNILNALNLPICFLSIPNRFYFIFHHVGISRILDFLIWHDSELHYKTGIPYKHINKIKNTLTLERIRESVNVKAIPVSAISTILQKFKLQQLTDENLSLQEIYYSLPYSDQPSTGLTIEEKDRLYKIFRTPISLISQIKSKWISSFYSNGIYTFIDLLSWSRKDLAEIVGRDQTFIDELLKEFVSFSNGMPLISLGVFDDNEIKILISKGFETVEDLYFCARREVFGVMGVKWKKVERYQRILETPVAMLQLQSSSGAKSSVRISHDGLERLAENGIDQIIKLIYWNEEELKSILKISLEKVKELKQAIAIKEQGMPLEIIAGYNRKTITTLIGYGIETVEDLYFSASEDMIDEDDDLDWGYVEKAIKALDLPVSFISGIIADKYIRILIKKKIDTLLRLLITSEEELSEVLETPPENVANLRQRINLIKIKESTDTSISILEGLSHENLKNLADEGIFTLYDFLTTTDEKLINSLELETNRVKEMKESLNYSNIESLKEEKMIPLTKISLINKRMIKKLARIGIESLGDLYYVATPKSIEQSDIEWEEIQEIRTTLDMPIEISPIILGDESGTLRGNKIETILDLLMASPEELEKKTKIPSDKIKVIQESYNIDEILNLLKRIPLSKIDLPTVYQDRLKQEKISTLYELLNHSSDDLYISKKGDRKIKVPQESWEKLLILISLPLSLTLAPDSEEVKKLKQKRILTLRDVYVTTDEKLEEILETNPNQFLHELEDIDFSILYQFTQIPVCFFPKLPSEWLPLLREHSILRVNQFFLTDPKELAEKLSTSLPKIRAFLSSLSMAEILKCLEEEMIPLETLSSLLSESDIKNLENQGITSVQEILLHDSKEFKLENHKELFSLLESPINRLSESLSLAELRKLSNQGINTMSDWFFLPSYTLAKILGQDKEKIRKLKMGFDIQSSSDIMEYATPLDRYIESGYVDFEELNKLGIKVLEDLVFVEIENLALSDQLKSRLANLKDALNSSLAYYSLLPSQYVIPLAFNGITSVFQFIQTEFSQLENPMNISEEEYNRARDSLNLVSIITHKKSESEFRVKLSSLRAFTSNQLEQIQKLGINDVIDLYFRLELEQVPKSLLNSVESIKRVLEKPVAILPNIQETSPQKIPLLFNAGITSTIEFLFWNKDELADLLEIKRYEVSRLRKIDLGAMKRKKNLGTPIENLVRIPEEYIEVFKEMGIDNIEDLYFHLKRNNFIPEDIIPSKLINACLRDLENPVVRLANLPIPVAEELVKKGVSRIIDFLYWPEEDLKTVYGLSANKIKQIKSRVRLRRKKEVLGRIESYMDSRNE